MNLKLVLVFKQIALLDVLHDDVVELRVVQKLNDVDNVRVCQLLQRV